MVNLLNLIVITNLFLYLLTTWKIHLLIPQVPHLFTPTGSCESMSQAWVDRSAYLSRFIRAKNVFIIKAHLLRHWGRDKCYLPLVYCKQVTKWGSTVHIRKWGESTIDHSWTWPPLLWHTRNNCWLSLLPTHQSVMEMMPSWCLHFN